MKLLLDIKAAIRLVVSHVVFGDDDLQQGSEKRLLYQKASPTEILCVSLIPCKSIAHHLRVWRTSKA